MIKFTNAITNSGNRRLRTAKFMFYVWFSIEEWTTAAELCSVFEFDVHERTVKRSLNALAEIGVAEKRLMSRQDYARPGNPPLEFRQSQSAQLSIDGSISEQCPNCRKLFVDMPLHRMQFPQCRLAVAHE